MSREAPKKPEYARNMRLLGHTDMGGRPDGQQVMVNHGTRHERGHFLGAVPARMVDERPGRTRALTIVDAFADAEVSCTRATRTAASSPWSDSERMA